MNLTELFTAIQNTLLIIALCLAIAIPIGTFLALMLFRTNAIGTRWAWIALGSQLAVPLYAFAGGWSAGFGMQGWFTSLKLMEYLFSGAFSPGTPAWQTGTGALLAVTFIHTCAAIPWVTLLISFGLTRTDRSQEEQALLDGGWTNVLWRLILPKLRLWMLAAALWCTIPIVTEMVVSNLYQVPTVAEQVYLDASRGSVGPLTYVCAILVCMLPLVIALGLLLGLAPPWRRAPERSQHFAASPLPLGRWRTVLSLVVWSLVAGLVALPIVNLIAKAGWQPTSGQDGRTHYGWSSSRLATTAYESITLFQAEFYWSGLLAVASSSLALAIAWAVFALAGRRCRVVFSGLMILTIAVPGPLVSMLVIGLLNRSTPSWLGWLYDNTLAAPILAQEFRLLPIAWILVHALHAMISSSTWEQVKLDGLTRGEILRRVVWPQIGYRGLAAWLLLAVLSVGELSCSILVLPPGVTTISMRLFEMLHFGMRHQDSGLCGVLLMLGWLVSLSLWKTLKER